MDKSGAKFKFVGHSTEIIRQSKNKGTLLYLFTRGRWVVQKGQNSVYINIERPLIENAF